MHSQIIPNTDFPACAKTYCPFYTEQYAIVIYYTWKIFPVRQWDMWRCIMCDMITISFPIFCPDKCYFTSFTTKEYTHCYRVPCEGYGCWEARGRGRERERETSSWALSPLSWAVLCTAHYTVQADTAGLGHWGVSDTELARPETRGCHLSCLQSTDNICCSSPGLGCCDSVCDLVWRNVTVWQVSHMTRRLSGKSILTVALFIKHNHNKDDKVFRQIGI